MKQLLKNAWAALVAAQERRARVQVLRQLDARTLKDIGLESRHPELFNRLQAMRRQDALAWRVELSVGGLR
jgi:hypothetical protein